MLYPIKLEPNTIFMVSSDISDTLYNENSGKDVYRIILNPLYKVNSFKKLVNGKYMEKFEALILKKVWDELKSMYTVCSFEELIIEPDRVITTLSFNNQVSFNKDNVINEIVNIFKHRSEELIYEHLGPFKRILWAEGCSIERLNA